MGKPSDGMRRSVRHPSITRVLETMSDGLTGNDNATLVAALAKSAGISQRHFSRLFTRDVGLSLPAYVRWLRLRRVAVSIAKGASLTQAAHAAGFSDSAHMSRVFRATFGMTPTQIATGTRIHACDLAL